MSAARPRRRVVRAEPDAELAVGDESLVLVGPPDALSGSVMLRNEGEERLVVRGIAVKRGGRSGGLLGSRLAVRTRLEPGARGLAAVSAALPSTVAPGEYLEHLEVRGKEVPVRLLVQPLVRVEVTPCRLDFVGIEPGLVHRALLVVSNQGNIPVEVPSLRHGMVLEADALCRNLTLALREKGAEGATATLDAFARGLREEMAGWVAFTVEEARQVIAPGESVTVHLSLELPKDVQANRVYEGAFRLLGRLVRYTITRAPREPRPAPTGRPVAKRHPGPRARGGKKQ